jgi:hypothetical protein
MNNSNTKVTYMYRDASNYKYWGSFVVKGHLAIEELEPYFFDSEFFVATEVGLKHLLTDSWNEDDHVLHTISEMESTEQEECICTASEFVKRFKDASTKGWLHSYV